MSIYFRFLVWFISYLILWIILSGKFAAYYIISGLITSIIAVIGTEKIKNNNNFIPNNHKYLQLAVYFFWLLKEIFISSIAVTKIIWDLRLPINPVFVKYRHPINNPVITYLTANSITLTPGTVALKADENEILVHELNNSNIQDLEKINIYKKVNNCFF